MSDSSARPSLADQLDDLGLSEREWLVLEGRVGLGERLTLQELADDLNLSRERVRQLQQSAAVRVRRLMLLLTPAARALENQGELLWDPFSPQTSNESVVASTQRLFTRAGWIRPSNIDVFKFFTVLRTVVDEGGTSAEKEWPRLSYAVCGLSPVITNHVRAAKQAERRQQELRDQQQTWSYLRLVTTVLKQASSPLHWHEIATRAEALGHRREFNAGSLFNTLTLHPDVFARVGPGTYGLVAAGYQRVENYVDIIASILRTAEKPLAYGEIFQEVNAIRPIKSGSLQLYLDTHARFYRSLEGTYGLRARLLPSEKQTLRTPPWQVEDPNSYERVGREQARGVDIEGVIAEDRECE